MLDGSEPRRDCQDQNMFRSGAEEEDHERIERLEPGRGDVQAKEVPVRVPVGPELQRVALLLVDSPEDDIERAEQLPRPRPASIRSCVSGFLSRGRPAVLMSEVGGEGALPEEVEAKTRDHADAGGAEAVVPAEPLAECAADQRRKERAEIDPHVEDREGAVPSRITLGVKASDLCRDVRLEGAVAEDQEQQRREEKRLDGHEEMADRHQDGAEDHRAALADYPVREHPSEEGGQVDERGVEPVDLRGERLWRERPEDRLEPAFNEAKPEHPLPDIGMQEQVVDHVEDEKRAHPVVGEALPHLGEEEDEQTGRMPQDGPALRDVSRRNPGLLHHPSLLL